MVVRGVLSLIAGRPEYCDGSFQARLYSAIRFEAVGRDRLAFVLHYTSEQPSTQPCHIRTNINSKGFICYKATRTALQVGSAAVLLRQGDNTLPVRFISLDMALEGERTFKLYIIQTRPCLLYMRSKM